MWMNQKDKTIGVIGLWHLGTIICAVWSKLGFRVIGFDYDKERVENLRSGIIPIYEPNLAEDLNVSSERNLLSFSSDISCLSECDFIFLSYDTPVDDHDNTDTTILKKSVLDTSRVMKNQSVLIVSSQSPVGYCSTLRRLLRKTNDTLELAYSPENLRLGEAVRCYLNPGRIILGRANTYTEEKCIDLFRQITNKVVTMSLESAEMVKHGINSFLAMSIVFINNLADICEEKNAVIDDVSQGMKSDPRISQNAYLSPGIGFSGGTLGRDLKVLDEVSRNAGASAELFGTIYRLNENRKNSIINRVKRILKGLDGKTIGVLGLTYKPGTSTLKRSLPLEIVDLFLRERATVKVYDPKADYSELNIEPKFVISKNINELSSNADILILLTDWPDFKDYDWNKVIGKTRTKIFYDTKNFLDQDRMKGIGFKYYSIGRGRWGS